MGEIVLLNDMKFEGTINLPIFEIEYIKSDLDLDEYDSLIFTSKNAIYSLNSFNEKWKELDSFAISKKTAHVISENGGNVFFTGLSAHGNEFAKELIPVLKNKNCLYIKAEKTVSNLVSILLDNNINVDELITYKTICSKKNFILPCDGSVLIFSSPSSIKCFFSKFSWNSTYKAVVIGQTTASFMPKNIEYKISDIQSVESCIKLAKTMLLN